MAKKKENVWVIPLIVGILMGSVGATLYVKYGTNGALSGVTGPYGYILTSTSSSPLEIQNEIVSFLKINDSDYAVSHGVHTEVTWLFVGSSVINHTSSGGNYVSDDGMWMCMGSMSDPEQHEYLNGCHFCFIDIAVPRDINPNDWAIYSDYVAIYWMFPFQFSNMYYNGTRLYDPASLNSNVPLFVNFDCNINTLEMSNVEISQR